MPDPVNLTERQRQWFASVRATLESSTGRSLQDWAEVARRCPETAHRKRLAWMKQTHGLGQNYASVVLNAAFPPEASLSSPDALADALWTASGARAILQAVQAAATALPDVIVGQRRGFTAFSRRFQFAAARPVKAGVRLGLALEPSVHTALVPAAKEGWSERLQAALTLSAPGDFQDALPGLLQLAWEKS